MPHTLPFLDISHESCQYHFKLTNHGKRRQRLYWLTDDSLPSTKTRKVHFSGRTVLPPISTPRKKDISGCRSLFSVSPPRVELFPGCSVDMVLTGSSDSPRVRLFAWDPKSEQNKSLNYMCTESVSPSDKKHAVVHAHFRCYCLHRLYRSVWYAVPLWGTRAVLRRLCL